MYQIVHVTVFYVNSFSFCFHFLQPCKGSNCCTCLDLTFRHKLRPRLQISVSICNIFTCLSTGTDKCCDSQRVSHNPIHQANADFNVYLIELE